MEKSSVETKGELMAEKSSSRHVDEVIIRLFDEVSPLIAAARERAAVVVNVELTNLNWNIGNRINREILDFSRAEYGKQVIKGLAHKLMLTHGSGWDEKTLRHCLRVAETFWQGRDCLRDVETIDLDANYDTRLYFRCADGLTIRQKGC